MPDSTLNKNKYWMPPHTRACVTATGAILLDLKRNRYFGLGYREARALRALALNWAKVSMQADDVLEPMPLSDAMRLADAWVRAGFLTPVAPEEAGDLPCAPVEPAVTWVDNELQGNELLATVRVGFSHAIVFARACLWAKRAVDSRLLYSVVREVGQYKREAQPVADIRLAVQLVHVFRRLRPYAFSAKDQCLFHALALLRFLAHYKVFPTWVIAVRPRPWAAHSWLQLGGMTLDCTPEDINGYTPILAI